MLSNVSFNVKQSEAYQICQRPLVCPGCPDCHHMPWRAWAHCPLSSSSCRLLGFSSPSRAAVHPLASPSAPGIRLQISALLQSPLLPSHHCPGWSRNSGQAWGLEEEQIVIFFWEITSLDSLSSSITAVKSSSYAVKTCLKLWRDTYCISCVWHERAAQIQTKQLVLDQIGIYIYIMSYFTAEPQSQNVLYVRFLAPECYAYHLIAWPSPSSQVLLSEPESLCFAWRSSQTFLLPIIGGKKNKVLTHHVVFFANHWAADSVNDVMWCPDFWFCLAHLYQIGEDECQRVLPAFSSKEQHCCYCPFPFCSDFLWAFHWPKRQKIVDVLVWFFIQHRNSLKCRLGKHTDTDFMKWNTHMLHTQEVRIGIRSY